jgi:hypothetical protein
MGARAEVFISATTRELRSYRDEVKNALLTLGIFPIEQTNFRLAHGPLTAKLHSLIASCDAVIHLVGFYYGAEPSQRPSGEPRRSYTQIEYDVARELRTPLFLFLAAESCGFDDSPQQSEEERTLQLAHRRAIEECDDVYYSFANHEDLARRVFELEFLRRPQAGAANTAPFAFLCHSSQDKLAVRKLYQQLIDDGFSAWFDEEDLLPGQEWETEIRNAVRTSKVVVVCLSRSSITKEGFVQKEIRYALDVAAEKPPGIIFLIPARLDECEVPERLKDWQWVDLFKNNGYERLLKALRKRGAVR